jgi:sugar lactone lactonase YvrE
VHVKAAWTGEYGATMNTKLIVFPVVASFVFVLAGQAPASVAEEPSAATKTSRTIQRASIVLAETGKGPSAVVVDPFGGVYTADTRGNTVTKITPEGDASVLGTTGKAPTALALDSAGNVYTSNSGDNTVTKISPAGVSTLLGSTGNKPMGIKVDASGNVYTSNYLDSTVTKITAAGVSTTLAATGTHPLGLALDSAGNVYTANEGSDTVTKITPAGIPSTLGTTGGWPQAIAIDASGSIFTANWNSANVSRITSSGASSIIGATGRRPIGITLDPYGNVYVTNDGSDSVSQLTTDGQSRVIAKAGRRPVGITSDAAGNLFVANALSNTVSQIVPRPPVRPHVVSISTVTVASPSNPSAWIIPFYNDVYESSATCQAALPAVQAATQAAPDPAVQKQASTSCMEVGSVPYTFDIAETELTVAQWVVFLNTADPFGSNRHHLWDAPESSTVWPKFGSINRNMKAPPGQRYYVASSAWANKPYNSADFSRAARFVNSLENGKVLSKKTSFVTTVSGERLQLTTYEVRLSSKTDTGKYTMKDRRATRNSKAGFAVSSQNEWIKAAYYDPKGGGKFSYWDYPTNPGQFVNCPVDTSGCSTGGQPTATQLDANGNVINAGTQPLATFEAVPGTAPDWCPQPFTAAQCAQTPVKVFPSYVGNVSSVGQALSRSPWGTLDQGGNVVEVTDTIAPPPELGDASIVWRRWHGGVVTATAYQMWLSAVGVTPQTIPGYSINPFRGIRLVVQGL